jgi:predicted DNA-binding transcriptional regulator AlpA
MTPDLETSSEAAADIGAVASLPDPSSTPTLGAEEVAWLWGCSKWQIYAHSDELPVKPIRVGRLLRWPTARVLASLGLDTSELPAIR